MKLFGISFESWLPWRMASRIRMLSFVLDKIGKGDFSQKAPISQDDIIGSLGIKINEIADSLSAQMNSLRRERTQLETMIDNMAEGVAVTDESGVIRLANPAWYRIFGSSPKSLGLPILESVRVPHIYDGIKRAVSSSSPSETDFGVGDRFFVARSVPFETGDAIGCVTVVNDVSRIKALENMRRDFTANVSHQMKTPLTSIIGYSETLLGDALNDPSAAKPFVETIHSQSLRLKELIDDVLKLARIESASWSLEPRNVELEAIVNEVVNDFKGNRNNVDISCAVDRASVISDGSSIKQILHNLIDNAVKYSPSGSSVRVSSSSDEGSVSISIEDSGAGIDPNELPRIFQRFYRVESLSKVEGTGLGLAIARHLADRINAQISVSSEVGKGSKFQLILPRDISQ